MMTPELQNIVERSYQVFKKYKATIPLDVCTACCLTKEQESQLVYLSVSEIPFDLLDDYNAAVIPTKPGIEEFKHFHAPELVQPAFHHYDKKEFGDPPDGLDEIALHELMLTYDPAWEINYFDM